jgi:hypothetical protein
MLKCVEPRCLDGWVRSPGCRDSATAAPAPHANGSGSRCPCGHPDRLVALQGKHDTPAASTVAGTFARSKAVTSPLRAADFG